MWEDCGRVGSGVPGRYGFMPFGHATLEKPTRHLNGDTSKAGGYSRVEFRGAVQAGDINLEVISSTRMD